MEDKTRAIERLVRPRIFYGWYIVLSCGVVAFYSWGLGFYGLGVYLKALHTVHGWPTSLISAAITLYYIASAALGLVIGGVVDRRGGKPVIVFGTLVMGASIVALGFLTAWWQLFAVFLVMSSSLASLSTTTIGGTLLPWFKERRGLAMASAMMGPSIGGMVLVPLLVYLTAQQGFRVATAIAAFLLWMSLLPLAAFVIKRRPEDLGLLPDGAKEAAQGGGAAVGPPRRTWTRREALHTFSFWIIAIPFSLGFVAQVGFLVHQLTFLEPSLGETPAAFAVSMTTFAALLSRIVLGVASDYLDRWLLAAGCVTIQGFALALMATTQSSWALLAGSVGVGIGVGTLITLPPLLTQEAFGTASFGTVFAMVNGALQVGVALGPTIVGLLSERWGGYEGALYVLATIDAIAMITMLAGRALPQGQVGGPDSGSAESPSRA